MFFFFFKQKTAYEMRISDWSSDVCSSDLAPKRKRPPFLGGRIEKLFGLFVVEPSAGSSAGSLQVHRLRTARVGLDFEAHLLAFDQRGHPRALDGGDMDENVLGAVLGRDETEAPGGVKEFHGSRAKVRGYLRTDRKSA